MTYAFVEISWNDAAASAEWEVIPEPILCVSRGWIVKETADWVAIAGALTAEGGIGSVQTIPRGMIVDVKPI